MQLRTHTITDESIGEVAKEKESRKFYTQSVNLSSNNKQWQPSGILYLGGLPTALWNDLKKERKAADIIGFTGYIYTVKINNKTLSLKKGTVYSKNGVINAFGSSEAGTLLSFSCRCFKTGLFFKNGSCFGIPYLAGPRLASLDQHNTKGQSDPDNDKVNQTYGKFGTLKRKTAWTVQ